MQPLLNASKAWHIILAASLKKLEPSIKRTKNKLSLVTEADEPETSFLVNARRWNNFTVSFPNLKHKLSSELTITSQYFSPEKI